MDAKKIKIVATLGPSSDSLEIIVKLAKAGVNVFRLNLSHGSFEEFAEIVKHVRNAEKQLKQPLTIMGDLAGPKIRIGEVTLNSAAETGAKIKITGKKIIGNSTVISVNPPEVLREIKTGSAIYLGDGDIKLIAEKISAGEILSKVTAGGALRSRMSFSVEGLSLKNFILSQKDKTDIKNMVKLRADALAVSFVQRKEDIEEVIKILPQKNRPFIIAKVETAKGVENAEPILEIADGLMVARGDLGLAVPIAEVPNLQKKLISLALKHAKPVITATQMLESMTKNPLPTRAEVTDVANAILDGTDAVMLSGETALGKFPVETVEMMAQIIKAATPHVGIRSYFDKGDTRNAVAASVVKIAEQAGTKAIVVLTHSGLSAKVIARHRPNLPILALSPNPKTISNLNFTWGTFPSLIKMTLSLDVSIKEAKKAALNNKYIKLKKGDKIVISAGYPFGYGSKTNLLTIQTL